jgi:hypothetical protein
VACRRNIHPGRAYYGRYPFGLELGSEGWAPKVLVSNPPGRPWLTDYCAIPHPALDVRCFVPDPPTTKGEGQELRRLVDRNGWRTVIVVTFQPYISRARFILEHCFDGDLVMVASPAQHICSRMGVRIRLADRGLPAGGAAAGLLSRPTPPQSP